MAFLLFRLVLPESLGIMFQNEAGIERPGNIFIKLH